MLEFFQKDLVLALRSAGMASQKRKSRLRVQVGGAVYPARRLILANRCRSAEVQAADSQPRQRIAAGIYAFLADGSHVLQHLGDVAVDHGL